MEGSAQRVPTVPGPEPELEVDDIAHLANVMGDTARARAVFGDPVDRDGVSVIPVARARWGFGGGAGAGPRGEGGGGGGGGGVVLKPVGFIEVRKGKSRYRPIVSPAVSAAAALAAMAFTASLLTRFFLRD